jgi:tripartite-type tricarboxylate transporter receptor subunit TctC
MMKIVGVVLTSLLLATFAGVAGAEDWPMRRLRIVVPFPAGGSGDVQVRIVADELARNARNRRARTLAPPFSTTAAASAVRHRML